MPQEVPDLSKMWECYVCAGLHQKRPERAVTLINGREACCRECALVLYTEAALKKESDHA